MCWVWSNLQWISQILPFCEEWQTWSTHFCTLWATLVSPVNIKVMKHQICLSAGQHIYCIEVFANEDQDHSKMYVCNLMQGQSLPISFHSQENQIHLKTKMCHKKGQGFPPRNISRSTYFYWLLPLAENGGLLTPPNHLRKLISQIISHPLSCRKLRKKEPSLRFGDEQPRHGGRLRWHSGENPLAICGDLKTRNGRVL